MSTQGLNIEEVRRISADRMPKVLAALADLGWKDTGKVRHPLGYPGNHRVVRGDKKLDVWSAVEDYRVVGIACPPPEMICTVMWDGEELRVTESVETAPGLSEFVKTEKTLADVPEIAPEEGK